MIITAKEIYDLARFAGFQIEPIEDEWELETEYTIHPCPKYGIKDDDSDERVFFYPHIATITDYPEEGAFGLGDEEEKTFSTVKIERWTKGEQKAY